MNASTARKKSQQNKLQLQVITIVHHKLMDLHYKHLTFFMNGMNHFNYCVMNGIQKQMYTKKKLLSSLLSTVF